MIKTLKNIGIFVLLAVGFSACQSLPLIGDIRWSKYTVDSARDHRLTCVDASKLIQPFNIFSWIAAPNTYFLFSRRDFVQAAPGYENAYYVQQVYARRGEDGETSGGKSLYLYDLKRDSVAYIGDESSTKEAVASAMRSPKWEKPKYVLEVMMKWLRDGMPENAANCKS